MHPVENIFMQPDGHEGLDALPSPGVNPWYVLGRLATALRTSQTHDDPETRARAERKVATWVAVYEGLLSGALHVGSRTPLADTPAWATPEVAHGGFATGSRRSTSTSSESSWQTQLTGIADSYSITLTS